jgi:hypothetical protein
MYSLINNADQVVNFLDWTTVFLLGGSAVVIGQSMIARLRNEWVASHAPSSNSLEPASDTYSVSTPEPVSESDPEPSTEPTAESTPVTDEPAIPDPWQTGNTTFCLLTSSVSVAPPRSSERLLKESFSKARQQYNSRYKIGELRSIAKSKGIKNIKSYRKRELIGKLNEVA